MYFIGIARYAQVLWEAAALVLVVFWVNRKCLESGSRRKVVVTYR